jgi:CxxC-x17-CxxC domain-containing protein
MPDYKNTNRFKKPFTRSGPGRPSFDGPKEKFKAECSNCHKTCEVPFRPNGKKPVFCSACFTRDGERDSRGSYQRTDYGSERTPRPQPAMQEDRRIDDLKRQIHAIDSKLELLIQMFEASRNATPAKEKAEPVTATASAPKAKKAVTKKKPAAKKS